MTGHSILRNYGENKDLKPNGMSAGVLALDMKGSKLYKYRTPRWRKLFPPSLAVSLSTTHFSYATLPSSSIPHNVIHLLKCVLQEQAINCQDHHKTDTLFWMFNETNLAECKKVSNKNNTLLVAN